MDLSKFSQIKYDHGESVPLGRWSIVAMVLVILAAAGLARAWPGSIVVGLIVVVILAIARPARRLCLGPRYLICGSEVFYYANVRRLTVDSQRGQLQLLSASGRTLVIDRDKFPTGARKPEKILINKSARFTKVAHKLAERVQRAAPGAELELGDSVQARTR